jgi:hypothetical protein
MSNGDNSLKALVDRMKAKAPELLDLFTAATLDQFENAFDTLLGKAVSRLEKNSRNFEKLGEVGLSAAIGGYLDCPGLTVTQEANSNGHVDLTIEFVCSSPPRTKLAEAKIHNGFQYHCGGLRQLLGRYTTGRESCGLLLVYVKKPNISGLMKELRDTLDDELPETSWSRHRP